MEIKEKKITMACGTGKTWEQVLREQQDERESGDYRWINKFVGPKDTPEAVIYYLKHGTFNGSKWDPR